MTCNHLDRASWEIKVGIRLGCKTCGEFFRNALRIEDCCKESVYAFSLDESEGSGPVAICMDYGDGSFEDVKFCPWCGKRIVVVDVTTERRVSRATIVP